jgi:hypothetical protein
MNNNIHGVAGMQGAPLAMAYQANNTNNTSAARKKISTQQQNRSHSVNNNS